MTEGMTFSIFDLGAMLLTFTAAFGWINRRFVRLPGTIGLLLMGLLASLLLVVADLVFPEQHLYKDLSSVLDQIDFTEVVMNDMLAFLLFAGAMNLNMKALHDRIWPVVALAVVGTVISTIVVGAGFWVIAQWMGYPMSWIWSLVFGALISPTDPIAVLSILKNVRVAESLKIEMQGEALFNDGISIVLFTLLVGIATQSGDPSSSIGVAAAKMFAEAIGGLAFGAATGYLGYRAMRSIDDFPIEVLITLALVTGTYSWAGRLGLSGPLSIVAAGIVVGYRAPKDAMSDRTERYVSGLWTLIDEVLNSVLFLLIGLEVLVLGFDGSALPLALAAIPIVLIGRLAAVSAPILIFPWSDKLSARNIPFLTWAGVRGGISIALALALPMVTQKPAILSATYAVVLFTLVVQGGTLAKIAKITLPSDTREDAEKTND